MNFLSAMLTSLPLDFEPALTQIAALGFTHVDLVGTVDRPALHLEALANSGLLVGCVAVGRGLPDHLTLDSADLASRRKAIELLALLASADQQLSYERDVPIADVPAELLCMWFDDFYDAKRIGSDFAFNEADRAALARFHHVFDERANRLPPSNGTVRTWLENSVWNEIMQEAARAIDEFSRT